MILLVVDDPLVQDVLGEALKDAGYAVHAANSGDEALHLVWHLDGPVSVLVTDIQLGPGPNGWDVARSARARNAELPVLYIPGDSEEHWPVEGVPNSVLLQKPIASGQLVTALSALCAAQPALHGR